MTERDRGVDVIVIDMGSGGTAGLHAKRTRLGGCVVAGGGIAVIVGRGQVKVNEAVAGGCGRMASEGAAGGPAWTTRPEVVIDRVTRIVSDLDRVEDDYVRAFGCSIEQRDEIEPSLTRVLHIPHTRGRRSLLRLGREHIELLEFADSAGRVYPHDSTSTDLWFQHIAIVVNDVTDAHQRVMMSRRFRPISRNGPVRLPDSSGGVTAFKFRDHDGHPLELLAFADGRVPSEWRDADGTGPFLGIDHTAIAVGDPAVSTGFFRSVFGFGLGASTSNRGSEQADLDDVDDVDVSALRLAPDLPAPRLELLHYHVGRRRPIPPDTASNDIAATHCVVQVASLDAISAALARHGMPLADDDIVVLHDGTRAVLISGPERHRFLVKEAGGGRDAHDTPLRTAMGGLRGASSTRPHFMSRA
jgi:catechol 2,3-dioxygenase-like lactoylglutathione lyase family enzyme